MPSVVKLQKGRRELWITEERWCLWGEVSSYLAFLHVCVEQLFAVKVEWNQCPGAPPSLLPRGAACFSSQDRKNGSGRAQGPGWPSQSWSHDQRTYGMWVVLNIFIHRAHLAFQGWCLWSYCLPLVSLAPNLNPEIVLDGITVGFASLLLCITASKTAQSTCYGSI